MLTVLRKHLHPLVKRMVTFGILSLVVCTAVIAAGLTGVAAHASSQTYTMTDLGTLGYPTTFGTGINSSGQIAGSSVLQQTVPAPPCPRRHPNCTTHISHAFLYSAGAMTDIGTLGGVFSGATAVNRRRTCLPVEQLQDDRPGNPGGSAERCQRYQQCWPDRRIRLAPGKLRTCVSL